MVLSYDLSMLMHMKDFWEESASKKYYLIGQFHL